MKKDKSWLGYMPLNDTRGTRTPSAKTLKNRANKAEAQRLAIVSANEAGYRRGKDEQDRELNTRHDHAMNILRNEMAGAVEDTIAAMDREITNGLLNVIAERNATNPSGKLWVLSVETINCAARELSRAYSQEKQA